MQRLHKRAIWYFFVTGIIGWIIKFLFLGFFFGIFLIPIFGGSVTHIGPQAIKLIIFLGPILYLIFVYVWAWLTWYFFKYELAPDGFRKEYGIIWKRYITIPYDRIQNVDIYRGILARIMKLSELMIQTAGHSGTRRSEGFLPGLSKETAEALRNELVSKTRDSRGSLNGGV